MSLLLQKSYTKTGRYDKTIRRQKVYGLCGICGIHGFAISSTIRSKTGPSQDIPLALKYCTNCKCVTVIDPKLKIVNKEGDVLS